MSAIKFKNRNGRSWLPQKDTLSNNLILSAQILQMQGMTALSNCAKNDCGCAEPDADDQRPKEKKINNEEPDPAMDNSHYPWDQCISDNEGKYGKESAAKICGAIKAKYGNCKECTKEMISNAIEEAFKAEVLVNAGTSEGAVRGWESRHNNPQAENALHDAIPQAKKSKTDIGVYHAPIEHAEQADDPHYGTYGYAPTAGADLLYKWADHIATVHPNGKVEYHTAPNPRNAQLKAKYPDQWKVGNRGASYAELVSNIRTKAHRIAPVAITAPKDVYERAEPYLNRKEALPKELEEELANAAKLDFGCQYMNNDTKQPKGAAK